MEYEMKSILRSKASLVFLLIFLIVNMFSMNFLNLENDVEMNIIHNEQLIVESQNSISQIDVIKKQFGEKIKPEQVEVLNNYKEYLNWKSKNANEAIDCLKKEGVKGFENYPDIKKYDLWNQMFEMDCFAKTDKQLSQVVFKDELAKIGYPDISFDASLLNDMQKFFNRDYEDAYHHTYMNLQNAFHEIATANNKNILNIAQGPWAYLCRQLRLGSLFSLMVIPIGAFYTLIVIWQQKQSKSFELSYLNSKSSNRFLLSRIIEIGISYTLIIFISLFVPALILGFRHGFDGLNSYMLIDWNNFVGFKTNLTSYNYGYAYSMFYEHLISMDNYMPINMENTYIFIPLILSLGLGMMKIIFTVTLGLLCSISVRKSWVSYALGLFIVLIHIYSQQITYSIEFFPMLNPFSILASLTVIVGNGTQTSLNAILMLVVWSILMYCVTVVIFNKSDVK